ncbi:TetR/AcrR family transcriptional regulator [Streptomyces sp. JV176]|uniref:TetR/AcrR family transcriptional regulator n=1 Tax=Streptomyces sp. JV176 TaxID=858630 RepID=UPI002E770ED1|nr:TetR/AcrR family transcriptional regulator [Streptomyces sp. JV176]MEE1797975.1 TetR/AcrR family transcriptional regulator [Streptomyces sp. JV176]
MGGRERADAARNRRTILLTARRLISESGVDYVSMDHIAEAAGVGKATLFRRFGDRKGLIAALFQQLTEEWEPGALERLADLEVPARERVLRFVSELFDMVVVPGRPLLRAMDGCVGAAGMERYTTWQDRLTDAIRAARPDIDARFMAHVLLNIPRADMVDMLVDTAGMSLAQVRAGFLALADAVLTGEASPDDDRLAMAAVAGSGLPDRPRVRTDAVTR